MAIKLWNTPQAGQYQQKTRVNGLLDAKISAPSEVLGFGHVLNKAGQSIEAIGKAVEREHDRLDSATFLEYRNGFRDELRNFKTVQTDKMGKNAIDEPNLKQNGVFEEAKGWFENQIKTPPKFRNGDDFKKGINAQKWEQYVDEERGNYLDYILNYQMNQEKEYKKSVMETELLNLNLIAQNSEMEIADIVARVDGTALEYTKMTGLDSAIFKNKAMTSALESNIKGLIYRGQFDKAEEMIESSRMYIDINYRESWAEQLRREVDRSQSFNNEIEKNDSKDVLNGFNDQLNNIAQTGQMFGNYDQRLEEGINNGTIDYQKGEDLKQQLAISKDIFSIVGAPNSDFRSYEDKKNDIYKFFGENTKYSTNGVNGAMNLEAKNRALQQIEDSERLFKEKPTDSVDGLAKKVITEKIKKGVMDPNNINQELINVRQQIALKKGLTDESKLTVLTEQERIKNKDVWDSLVNTEDREAFLNKNKQVYGEKYFTKFLNEIGVGAGAKFSIEMSGKLNKRRLIESDKYDLKTLMQGKSKIEVDEITANVDKELDKTFLKAMKEQAAFNDADPSLIEAFSLYRDSALKTAFFVDRAGGNYKEAVQEISSELQKKHKNIIVDEKAYFRVDAGYEKDVATIEKAVKYLHQQAGASFEIDDFYLRNYDANSVVIDSPADGIGWIPDINNPEKKKMLIIPVGKLVALGRVVEEAQAYEAGTNAAYNYTTPIDNNKNEKYKEARQIIDGLLNNNITREENQDEEIYNIVTENLKKEIEIKQKRIEEQAQQYNLQKQAKIVTGQITIKGNASKRFAKQVTPYNDFIEEASKKHKVPADLIVAVMATESNFKPSIASGVGAIGLMQLMPGTAKYLGVTDSTDPQQNINGGTKYLAEQLNKYNGDLKLALMAYNWGPGHVDVWIKKGSKESAIPKETKNHYKKIMGYLGE